MGHNSAANNNTHPLHDLFSTAELANREPWHLPSHFFMIKDQKTSGCSLQTPSGYWKENEAEFTAIRRSGASTCSYNAAGLCMFMASRRWLDKPSYIGLKRTLEFYLKDGTRTDWVIHQYEHFRDDFDLVSHPRKEVDVVIGKVFKKDRTHQTSSPCSDPEKQFKEYKDTTRPRAFALTTPVRFNLSGRIISDGDDTASVTELCRQVQAETNKLIKLFESGKVGSTVHSDAHAKSDDDVWQKFSKIRTSNPDVVYAVCHHCDKVLQAHPKKHGTSQLKRHMNCAKCRSSCSNPSTDEDLEMLNRLRAVRDDLYMIHNLQGELDFQQDRAMLDPWDFELRGLNPCYVTTSFNLRTHEGFWKEIDKEFTAIRMQQQQMQRWEIGVEISAIQNNYAGAEYMGLRRTLEFHQNLNDGNMLKTAWIMLEYQQVDKIEPPGLFLQGDMVIRKVFRYDKDAVTAIFSDFERELNADIDSEEHYNDSTLSTDYKHGGGDRKRKRTAASNSKSEVWMHFTKVYTADHDVVYAVCHICDRGYNGHSKNGTSHLWRHNKSCAKKCRRTENANDATTEWEAEIWPLFLVLKNYGETEQQGCADVRSQEDGRAC